jgi:hypothetical protein
LSEEDSVNLSEPMIHTKGEEGGGWGGVKLGTKHRVNLKSKIKLKMDNYIKNLYNFGP